MKKKSRQIFIIEHLEPELWPWCVIEYKHISKIIGKNSLWFFHIKAKDAKRLEKYGKVFNNSVKTLNLKNICILDPEAQQTLTPKTAANFDYFVFGGILGDAPPKKRTTQELTNFFPKTKSFNLGKEQMSTDNAVYTAKQIIGGKSLSSLKFKDGIEIQINKIESIIFPFRYNLVKGKQLISKELIAFLKKQK
jgi:ribosome biogenesis SPOUT family RNA methylase Rps3